MTLSGAIFGKTRSEEHTSVGTEFPVFLQIPDKTVLLPLPDKAFDKSCGEPQPSVLSRSAHQVLSFLLHSS